MKTMIKNVEVSTPSPLKEASHEVIEACFEFFEEGGIALVECHENYIRGALLCSALAWTQKQLQTSEKPVKKIVYLCEKEEALRKVWQDMQCTDYAELIMKSSCKDFSIFKEEMKSQTKGVLPIFMTQRSFLEEIITATNKFQSETTYHLQDTLLIVDDAHGVDHEAREAASCCLSLCVIESVRKELSEDSHSDPSILSQVIVLIDSLKKFFFRGITPHRGGENDPSFSLDELNGLLRQAKLSDIDYASIGKNLDNPNITKVVTFVSKMLDALHSDISPDKCYDDSLITESNFKLYATDLCSESHHMNNCPENTCKSIIFACFDASFAIKRMVSMKPHSVVLSSSSLSPFKYLKGELGLKEAKEFVGKTSVEDHQLFARIITCGAGGYFLNSSYNLQYDDDYLSSLGKTVLELVKITPQGEGVIIYFPSVEFQSNCIDNWQSSVQRKQTLWKEIDHYKDIITSSKGKFYNSNLSKKLETTQNFRGSCVLAVLCSEVSEYTFLPKQSCRVVVIVGVPFIPENNPKIKLKKQYNRNRHHCRSDIPTGSDYIHRESYKLIRQVLDSQISSMSDYSIILLLDTHYDINLLSPWLRHKIIKEKRFVELLQELEDFLSLVKNRVLYMKEKSENVTQSSTQFGKVPRWEMEKLCTEYKRLKKNNDNCQRLKEKLQNELHEANKLQENLQQKIKSYVSPLKRPHQE